MSVLLKQSKFQDETLDGLSPEVLLEPDQLAIARRTPLQRRRLGRGMLAMMWILRIYVFLALPLVAYVFFSSMRG